MFVDGCSSLSVVRWLVADRLYVLCVFVVCGSCLLLFVGLCSLLCVSCVVRGMLSVVVACCC